MRAIVLIFALSACTGETSLYQPDVVLPDALVTCTTADDCTLLQLGCCDHCNGGQAVAVNTDSATQVTADYSEVCNDPVACTEMGCAPLEAECTDDVCVAIEQPFN